MFIFVVEVHWVNDFHIQTELCLWCSLTASIQKPVLPQQARPYWEEAVIPKNIPFNRVRRVEVLQQCDGNAGQLWQYSTSKESLQVQDQSCYHCLTCPALHPLSLLPAPALLTFGRSPRANPCVLLGVEPDRLCLALLNSIILVLICSTKELLFIDFSSWGLGKKGLRESHLFQGCFESEIMQNIHQGDLRYFYTRAIERSSVLSLVSRQ